ncbi:hypothetical protein NEOC65_001457 [Neochlamydia sp. AcF65]|nr:hypothetical protein [Neochlamydia sp. AcF65]
MAINIQPIYRIKKSCLFLLSKKSILLITQEKTLIH